MSSDFTADAFTLHLVFDPFLQVRKYPDLEYGGDPLQKKMPRETVVDDVSPLRFPQERRSDKSDVLFLSRPNRSSSEGAS
jgi:hypothetical protein